MTKGSLTAALSHAPSPQGEGCLLRPSEIHHARLPNSDFVIPSCFAHCNGFAGTDPPVIPTTDICRNIDILVCAPNRHSCLFPHSRLKARWAHRLQAHVPLTRQNARRVFYRGQDWPFAPSAGALLRICFPARRSGERAAPRPYRRWESYEATLPAMFPRQPYSWE